MRFGRINWELHFVPKVPDSNKGFRWRTALLSTYYLALTLSTAFTTKSKESQYSSVNLFSDWGCNLASTGTQLKSGLNFLASFAEV